jgi:flagellar biosynthesis protein FliQ
MGRKIKASDFGSSPGKLYTGITATGEKFVPEKQIEIEKDPPFVVYCKKMAKKFPSFKKNARYSDKHKKAIEFLGWKLSPGEFMAAIKGTFLTGIIPIILVIALIFIFGVGFEIGSIDLTEYIGGPFLYTLFDESMVMTIFLLVSALLMGVLGGMVYYFYSYPLGAATQEQNKALTYVPEMIGYMIMSMKLVPNLEKAIEFSAKHGRGKIAVDLKRLIWDFQIGLHESISQGLDALAYNWGEYSSELKEALMKIRASVLEPSESHRYQLLDKTMLEVLERVKTKMEDYARGLNQPSVMLFYLGVLLPLILIIILPVGSAFSGNAFATTEILFMIYCVGIPLASFIFAKNVVAKRPPTYEPPEIKDDFAGLPKKWHMKTKKGSFDTRVVFAIILIIGFSLSFAISSQGIPPKFLLPQDEYLPDLQIIQADRDLGQILKDDSLSEDYLAKDFKPFGIDLYFIEFPDIRGGEYYQLMEKDYPDPDVAYEKALQRYLQYVSTPSNDPTKHLFWSGVIITLAFAISFLLYHKNIYKRRAQLNIIKMEDEFKESMYVIASRMGENKPVENALKQARDFLPDLLISKRIFGRTVENIELMGLPLEGAIFDPIYGSMKGIPSKVLKTAMRLLVDSVSLGVEVASRTLMSLSLQMENMDKVNKSLKDMVSDVSTTMQTMALFIGPIVLGITVALQKVVMMTLAGVVADPVLTESQALEAGSIGIGGANIQQMFQLTVTEFQKFATPLVFLIIISIYVMEIVIVMIYFTTKVQEDNDLLFKVNLARALPIATTVFVITALIANIAVTGLMGG